MSQLFGVSMNLIMYVLLALLAVALVSVSIVALRNRVMFKLGIRNIPRRRAQTALIVIGLMLSTVIISAAFSTGDTVNRSITKLSPPHLSLPGHTEVKFLEPKGQRWVVVHDQSTVDIPGAYRFERNAKHHKYYKIQLCLRILELY